MKDKITNLQVLRALAAVSVIVFHAINKSGGSFEVGQAGVDIFFVLSGFIMVVLSRRPITPLAFLRERFVRIIPLYWICTLAMAAGAAAHLFPNLRLHWPDLFRSLFFIPYRRDGVHPWPIVVPGWTLNYELFFYCLFAALLLLPGAARVWVLAALLLGLTWLGPSLGGRGSLARFYTNSITLEFAFGGLFALLAARWKVRRSWPGWVALTAGLVLFVLPVVAPVGLPRVALWGGPALLLVAGGVWLEQAGVRISGGPLVFLGDASYSIYLAQPLAISVAFRAAHALPPLLLAPALSLACLALGSVTYLCVERPLMKAMRRMIRRKDDVLITTDVLSQDGAAAPA